MSPIYILYIYIYVCKYTKRTSETHGWHRCKWKMFKEKKQTCPTAQRPTTSGSSCSQALKRLGRSEREFLALAVPRLHEKVRNLIPKMLMQACPDERQFFHAPSDAMDPKHGWIHQSCQAQATPNCMFLLQEANNWCSRFRHHFRTQQSHAHPVKQACGMPDPFRSDVMKPHADQIGLKFAVIWLAFALRMQRAALQLGHSFPWPRGSSTVPDCRLQAEPGQGYFRFRAASVLFYNRLA